MEHVTEAIPIPENETTVIIPLNSFAVSVREVEPENQFEDLTFSAVFGDNFEFTNSEGRIDADSLVFEEHPQATASITLPNDILKRLSSSIDDRNESISQRIINSVYLTDVLFTRRIENSFRVGSIIISATISGGVTIQNLSDSNPITMQFLKSPVSTIVCKSFND